MPKSRNTFWAFFYPRTKNNFSSGKEIIFWYCLFGANKFIIKSRRDMNEKTLEKVTGLSRRQIIMLQKTCIKRKNKIVVGLSYDYSDDEVLEFMLAKVFKDCGYSYPEIKVLMDRFRNKDLEVIDDAIIKTKAKIKQLEAALEKVYELKEKYKN